MPKSFHKVDSLVHQAKTIKAVDPLGQIILAWKLCLHASIYARYSSSGIAIAKLSPLRTGFGSWDDGISYTLETAWAKVFVCLGIVWGGFLVRFGVDVLWWRHFQAIMEGFFVVSVWSGPSVGELGFSGLFEILDGLFVGSGYGLFFRRQHQGMTTTSMMIGAKRKGKNERVRDYL